MSLNSGANFSVDSSFEATGENPEETNVASGMAVVDSSQIQYPLGTILSRPEIGQKFTLNVRYYTEIGEPGEEELFERTEKVEITITQNSPLVKGSVTSVLEGDGDIISTGTNNVSFLSNSTQTWFNIYNHSSETIAEGEGIYFDFNSVEYIEYTNSNGVQLFITPNSASISYSDSDGNEKSVDLLDPVSGAVRYDEEQYLEDRQKNQAKSNLELPFETTETYEQDVELASEDNVTFPASADDVSITTTVDDSNFADGKDNYKLTLYTYNDGEILETIHLICDHFDDQTGKWVFIVGEIEYPEGGAVLNGQDIYIDASSIDFYYQGTDDNAFAEQSVLVSLFETVQQQQTVYNNKLNVNLIDGLEGTNDGTNWTSLTIGDETYGFASGGGSAPSNMMTTDTAQTVTGTKTFKDSVVLTPTSSSDNADFTLDFGGNGNKCRVYVKPNSNNIESFI